ncbi:hypothetical protein [Litoreibacter roseus]|uniref:Uncharacterized protein n=1 Tax=Litoreibacter roseus TaxID=2601869 RepID=A0A6N6JF87_9RHOB|nr:hypothetical protein [Litoreibacter roseus]GFE65023.1 hypothetical protein KIN_20970 [Litoreibacter roseus]
MTTFLSREVQDSLAEANLKRLRAQSRLCVHAGNSVVRILEFRPSSFSIAAEDASHVGGLVDIYDGPRHLYQALIVASSQEDGLMSYEFKRNTLAAHGPALDFERKIDAPAGLIEAQ